MEAFALEGLCSVAAACAHPSAEKWIHNLETFTGRSGMRELLARAYLHRGTLGAPGAIETARLLASEIDNGALESPVEFNELAAGAGLAPDLLARQVPRRECGRRPSRPSAPQIKIILPPH